MRIKKLLRQYFSPVSAVDIIDCCTFISVVSSKVLLAEVPIEPSVLPTSSVPVKKTRAKSKFIQKFKLFMENSEKIRQTPS